MRLRIPVAAAVAALASLAVPAAAGAAPITVKLTPNADRCEFLAAAGGRCLLPFPSDWYTVADTRTATGRRLNFKRASMPSNVDGVRIDPREWNRNDGFSPGQPVTVKVPGLDTPAAFTRTAPVPIGDMKQYARSGAPVVVIDTVTHRRHLIWTELDATAGTAANTSLIIRPGRNWVEGRRYVVALRRLKTAAGATIAAPPAFRAYRDGRITRQRIVESRRARMERIFKDLKRAGIGRSDLYLAWDFTVASGRNLSERMLGIRDKAFAALGDRKLADRKLAGRAPTFAIDPPSATFKDEDGTWTYAPCDPDGCKDGQDDKVFRRVTGTVTVPCYLNQAACPPGARFNYAKPGDTVPSQKAGNVYQARFACKIPRASLNGPARTGNRAAIYGHGLLGDIGELNQGQIAGMIFEHGFVYCATNEIGMAGEDVPNAVAILKDLSKFPSLADRVQQGWLNELFLARAMIHPAGFTSNALFRDGGQADIDTKPGRAYYDGNSQGGIMGGGVLAVSPDIDRGALGVPGMNYSTLLQRSVDFNTYASILYAAYPDTEERQVYLSLIQMLWDRAEANGYAQHMTADPYANTPPHLALLQVAFGDHQVSDYAARVEARTIGARLYTPPLSAGRSLDRDPFYGIARITRYPYAGSAITFFDSGPIRDGGAAGTGPSPQSNVPNDQGDDPHELPRRTVQGRAQKSAFLSPGGKVIQACGSAPCFSGGWAGP